MIKWVSKSNYSEGWVDNSLLYIITTNIDFDQRQFKLSLLKVKSNEIIKEDLQSFKNGIRDLNILPRISNMKLIALSDLRKDKIWKALY